MTTYTYDALNRVIEEQLDNLDAITCEYGTRHDLDIDYDALGRLFDFDASGLAPLTSQEFSWDANSNRLSLTGGTGYPFTVTATTKM